MIVVIDNYDSFTWNLADLLKRYAPDTFVVRNNEISVAEVLEMNPDGIVLSPGPGRPADSGICLELTGLCRGRIPVLGICMGMQVIGELLGAKVTHSSKPMHGKTSRITHDGRGVFNGLTNPMTVMRYHSLVLEDLPRDIIVSAKTGENEIMGIRHKLYNFAGVQFHPESVLTEGGNSLIKNWTDSLILAEKVGKVQ